MSNRVALAITFVVAGIICITVSVLALAWMDNVGRHERTAEIQAAVQAELQGKSQKDLPPYSAIVSPALMWITFVIGGYFAGSGFVVGVRFLRVDSAASYRPTS
ncbi:MAG TPA: hypothetical protein VGP68_02830 [Gemmataceae bacterium]|jgi:hypothetical protein|nr:hypothetical protein [Gemmataceae bacterium]